VEGRRDPHPAPSAGRRRPQEPASARQADLDRPGHF
jgi:hypothetical protein